MLMLMLMLVRIELVGMKEAPSSLFQALFNSYDLLISSGSPRNKTIIYSAVRYSTH